MSERHGATSSSSSSSPPSPPPPPPRLPRLPRTEVPLSGSQTSVSSLKAEEPEPADTRRQAGRRTDSGRRSALRTPLRPLLLSGRLTLARRILNSRLPASDLLFHPIVLSKFSDCHALPADPPLASPWD
ncbi:unnamed protein product [Pleuronectes platessa]|uniref:Uncharacterized protein n=1 Tax=Pleuronectes platessa TaxID=8262 RepID=A0A9N7U299_PLEPL|nr:unnamed protein product [Pleuronectes platessa]